MPSRSLRLLLGVLSLSCWGACETTPPSVTFGAMGPLTGPLGGATDPNAFRFGVSTAATQIEDNDTNTDWYVFTEPTAQGGLGKDTFVSNAADGYTMDLSDIELLEQLHVDAYRFSMEWARIEPTRNTIDESALEHYSDLIDALIAHHIRPMVTVHHFANPIWVADPRDTKCVNGPTDTNLCGLGDPTGGPLVIDAMSSFASLLATRFGDRVDEWGTVNEPVNYLLAAYGTGQFPPGKSELFALETQFIPVVRDYLAAHAAMYKAIKAADTIDADGDGVAAAVGIPLSVVEWEAARDNLPSDNADDLAARDRIVYVYHHLVPDALLEGGFDTNLDGTLDEPHPEWQGTLDWLGVQYYFRSGVTAEQTLVPVLNLTPCFPPFDFGSCLKPLDPTFCVPQMSYEYDPDGLYPILADFGARWPKLPLIVTEGGIATDVGARRSANIVRSLEQIAHARAEGIDVRGYYHWSLYDNFEWQQGFAPHFGLFHTDTSSYSRTATDAVDVFASVATSRTLTGALRKKHGGSGPLPAEPGAATKPASCAQ